MDKIEIIQKFNRLGNSAQRYFSKCNNIIRDEIKENPLVYGSDFYWSKIPDDLKGEAEKIIKKLIEIGQEMAEICKNSLLINETDIRELSYHIKRLRSSIYLKRFQYSDPDVVHNEGVVLGFRPGSQQEFDSLDAKEASNIYKKTSNEVLKIFNLSDKQKSTSTADKIHQTNVSKYSPNTAFIMMWFDPSKPELEDVRDAVVEVFNKFGIKGVRADEIEHEGIITQRIIDEIKTSEFLYADLTGSRPSVYYEVGFAHALGKRVILYRKEGTGLHFDLAGYNCPKYKNLGDLKSKFTKRLETLTNKSVNA
jgi:hypothetical protein